MSSFNKNKSAQKIVDNLTKEQAEQKRQEFMDETNSVIGQVTHNNTCKHDWDIVIEGYKRHRVCKKCTAFFFIPTWYGKIYWKIRYYLQRITKND